MVAQVCTQQVIEGVHPKVAPGALGPGSWPKDQTLMVAQVFTLQVPTLKVIQARSRAGVRSSRRVVAPVCALKSRLVRWAPGTWPWDQTLMVAQVCTLQAIQARSRTVVHPKVAPGALGPRVLALGPNPNVRSGVHPTGAHPKGHPGT